MAYTYERSVKASVRLTPAVRSRLNSDIDRRGLDGNKPFQSIGKGLAAIGDALEENGLEWEGLLSADLFLGESGTRLLRFVQKNPQDASRPLDIANSVIRFAWYKYPSGNYELTAYAS